MKNSIADCGTKLQAYMASLRGWIPYATSRPRSVRYVPSVATLLATNMDYIKIICTLHLCIYMLCNFWSKPHVTCVSGNCSGSSSESFKQQSILSMQHLQPRHTAPPKFHAETPVVSFKNRSNLNSKDANTRLRTICPRHNLSSLTIPCTMISDEAEESQVHAFAKVSSFQALYVTFVALSVLSLF